MPLLFNFFYVFFNIFVAWRFKIKIQLLRFFKFVRYFKIRVSGFREYDSASPWVLALLSLGIVGSLKSKVLHQRLISNSQPSGRSLGCSKPTYGFVLVSRVTICLVVTWMLGLEIVIIRPRILQSL